MIKINKLTDYASGVLGQLMQTPNDYTPASKLAQQLGLSKATLHKILKTLSKAEYVNSTQGKMGGYQISNKAYTVTVLDLIALFENQIGLTTCSLNPERCPIEKLCSTKKNWNQINQLIIHQLHQINLSQFLGNGYEKP